MPALQNITAAQSVLSLAHRGPQAHRSAPRATYPVTIRNRTHKRGPTVGPQVLATCHPSSCRLLQFFRRHTAGTPRAHLPRAIRPAARAHRGPTGLHRAQPFQPQRFHSLSRRGPQMFPVWGKWKMKWKLGLYCGFEGLIFPTSFNGVVFLAKGTILGIKLRYQKDP